MTAPHVEAPPNEEATLPHRNHINDSFDIKKTHAIIHQINISPPLTNNTGYYGTKSCGPIPAPLQNTINTNITTITKYKYYTPQKHYYHQPQSHTQSESHTQLQ